MNWFTKFFSLDEQRVSALLIVLLLFCGISAYTIIRFHDIPPNVASIIETLVIAISGVNAVGWASNSIMSRYGSYGQYGGYNGYPYGMNNMGIQPLQTQANQLNKVATPAPEKMPIVNGGTSGSKI